MTGWSNRLAEEKAAAYITEILRAEMMLLFGRMEAVQRAALEDPDHHHADLYAPLPVVRALSRALDAQGIDPACGTFLLQNVRAPLLDTLKNTYTALNQFLGVLHFFDGPLRGQTAQPLVAPLRAHLSVKNVRVYRPQLIG